MLSTDSQPYVHGAFEHNIFWMLFLTTTNTFKPGLHESQQQAEWSVTFFFFGCSRATLLTWSAQRRPSTVIEETNVTLVSTGSCDSCKPGFSKQF